MVIRKFNGFQRIKIEIVCGKPHPELGHLETNKHKGITL
jgi:hypothetical protein